MKKIILVLVLLMIAAPVSAKDIEITTNELLQNEFDSFVAEFGAALPVCAIHSRTTGSRTSGSHTSFPCISNAALRVPLPVCAAAVALSAEGADRSVPTSGPLSFASSGSAFPGSWVQIPETNDRMSTATMIVHCFDGIIEHLPAWLLFHVMSLEHLLRDRTGCLLFIVY